MDAEKYASIIISHFQDIGYYSEIEPEKLEAIFVKYLEQLYNDQVQTVAMKSDCDKTNGNPWTSGRYELEVDSVNKFIIIKVKELLLDGQKYKVD